MLLRTPQLHATVTSCPMPAVLALFYIRKQLVSSCAFLHSSPHTLAAHLKHLIRPQYPHISQNCRRGGPSGFGGAALAAPYGNGGCESNAWICCAEGGVGTIGRSSGSSSSAGGASGSSMSTEGWAAGDGAAVLLAESAACAVGVAEPDGTAVEPLRFVRDASVFFDRLPCAAEGPAAEELGAGLAAAVCAAEDWPPCPPAGRCALRASSSASQCAKVRPLCRILRTAGVIFLPAFSRGAAPPSFAFVGSATSFWLSRSSSAMRLCSCVCWRALRS